MGAAASVRGMTAEVARTVWMYDPDSGILTWVCPLGGVKTGGVAGTIKRGSRRPHREVKYDGKVFINARIAWLIMTGEWPAPEVDHINRDATDDRWINLREATRSQQMGNTRSRKDSALGLRGVYQTKYAFVAKLGDKYLGSFRTAEDAKAAYDAAAAGWYGDFRLIITAGQQKDKSHGPS